MADPVLQAADLLAQRRLGDARAGCRVAEVVRVRSLLPDREDFEPCWPVLRRCFGDVRPAATMLVCGLSDPRMKIEIEVDAWRRVPPRDDVPSNHPEASAVPVVAHEPPYYAAVFTTVRTQDQSDYSETNEWRTEDDRREDPCR
ncbi:Rid family hydrolase [Streptomyces hokutonensis]|uniref:Rid family hydrolase n=1 Tax=Streptomyces hokutonensis TaxID=1306990 RepID=UPI0038049D34